MSAGHLEISRAEIQAGSSKQRELKETPTEFRNPEGLQKNSSRRMAGLMGERAQNLMNDPMEKQRTDEWMGLFGLSNEGSQFEQAKIQKAMQGMI